MPIKRPPVRHESPSLQFDTMLQVRAPEALRDALDTAADQKLISRSDYVREALADRLKADGVKFPAMKLRAVSQ